MMTEPISWYLFSSAENKIRSNEILSEMEFIQTREWL